LITLFDGSGLLQIIDLILSAQPSIEQPLIASLSARYRERKTTDQVEESVSLLNGLMLNEGKEEKEAGSTPTGTTLCPSTPKTPQQQADGRASDTGNYRSREAPTVIQFITTVFYALEEENKLTIDVVRMGNSSETATVRYKTEDGSAKAGLKYMATEGTLTFAPGDTSMTFDIEIIDDRFWDATLEFGVELSEPVGAILGQYLHKCRVRIIDNDAFPTNRFREACQNYDFGNLPSVALFIEYLKFNFVDPKIRRGSLRLIVMDVVVNVCSVWRLFLMLHLMDTILDKDITEHSLLFSEGKAGDLAIVFAGLTLRRFILHWLAYRRNFLGVGGTSRMRLQANLVRKFLNYENNARAKVRHSDLMLAIARDSRDLVRDGYMAIFKILKELSMLVFLFFFQVSVASQGEHFSAATDLPVMVLPSIMFPIAMLGFLKFRENVTSSSLESQNDAENDLAYQVENTITHFDLIRDYQRRPQSISLIEKCVAISNNVQVMATTVVTNNKEFAPWLQNVVVGFWLIYGGLQVLSGNLTIGSFLTTVDVFSEVASSWRDIYQELLTIHSIFPALHNIVEFMNLPIDLRKRRELYMNRKNISVMERQRIRKDMADNIPGHGDDVLYATDRVHIRLEKLYYSYEPLNVKESRDHGKDVEDVDSDDHRALTNIDIDIPQGTLIAIVGRRGSGKSTLLRIMGSVLIPTAGTFFIPPNLRVFHVDTRPMFVHGTLLTNMLYGVEPGDSDGELERIQAIFRRLGVDEHLEILLSDKNPRNWDEVLTQTQKVQMHLIRALVANPEVLIVHKPTLVFTDEVASVVFRCLKAFVDKRGLDLNPEEWHLRRPRTCIITASRHTGCEMADKIYLINPAGCALVAHKEVTAEMLS